jgi:hypothetical protein
MAFPTRVYEDLVVPGIAYLQGGISPGISRTSLVQDTGTYAVPLSALRVFDDMNLVLPSAGGNDDLGIVEGTHGTNHPVLESSDFGGLTINQYARFLFPMPAEYVGAATIAINIYAGMTTTDADTTADLDLLVYKSDKDLTVTGDLCATAAIDLTGAVGTYSSRSFTITATSVSAGDILDCMIHFNGVDSGDAGVMKMNVTAIEVACGIKG